MGELFCGIDFGTTNSSVALSDGQQVRVLPLDPANDNPAALPSLLYITNEGEHIVGRRAANAFIERNVDREIILEQMDLGVDIEAYVGAEPDKSEGYRPGAEPSNVREAMRARATVEVNSPGRLFQSLKTQLRHVSFRGTHVFGTHYQIEELVAHILRRIKKELDAAAGRSIEKAVLGRPVRFSRDPKENEVAEHRLRTAADLAGFKELSFFYEPVGACVEYAMAAERKQRLMVVDIGGGTCDVCIMEFGGGHGTAVRLAESRILSVAGVPVAGDAIDREIIKKKLFPVFGSRARYGPSKLRIPQYLFNEILDWQNLYKLNTEEMINWLLAIEVDCTDPQAIRALRMLIQRNYGYPVAREVELAKKRLSESLDTEIALDMDAIHIREHIAREEFADIIDYLLDQMLHCIEEAESGAQLESGDIDLVLTTGGTSLIPAIRHMLVDRFGEARLMQRDTFTSVATGLALVAQHA
ncbi:MAG: Hsp70 family protein [Candidatus Hydrogenedentota bacterium]